MLLGGRYTWDTAGSTPGLRVYLSEAGESKIVVSAPVRKRPEVPSTGVLPSRRKNPYNHPKLYSTKGSIIVLDRSDADL